MESISNKRTDGIFSDRNFIWDFNHSGGKTIGIFAISTFNTDYILVKQDDFEKAIDALDHAGYTIERNI